jgi:DNA-binding GntR family transcriptional regulator
MGAHMTHGEGRAETMKTPSAKAKSKAGRGVGARHAAHSSEAERKVLEWQESPLSGEERLADRALRLLEEQIVTLQLPPGSVWSEAALSARIKIGRTPVREALQRLAADLLVVIMRRHGVMISQIDIQNQLFVLETRRQLEGMIASRAARRATPEEREKLLVIADAMSAAGKRDDVIGYLRYYFFSKKLLREACRNPYAGRSIETLHSLSRRFYFTYHKQFGDLSVVADLHAEQARAAARGDEKGALEVSDRILAHAEAFTKRTVTNSF